MSVDDLIMLIERTVWQNIPSGGEGGLMFLGAVGAGPGSILTDS